MNDVIEIIKIIIPVVGTLFGTLFGVLLTQKYQKRAFDRQIEIDNKKKKQMELEKKMKIYSEVLFVDGESIMIYEGSGSFHLNLERYKEKVRPVIYSGLHYFDEYPSKIIRSIDSHIKECDFREEVTKKDHHFFANKYSELINSVATEVSNYNNTFEID